jgi:antitoxin YefM
MTNIINVSDARKKLPSLVDKVSEGLESFLITVNNKPKAVLLSVEEAESLEETAEILSIPGAKASIKEGLKEAKRGLGKPLEDLLR